MIFPQKSDYPQNFSILDNHKEAENQLYLDLLEASASVYFKVSPVFRYFFKKRFFIAEDFLEKKEKFQRILDAGTGVGFFLPYLASVSQEVVGVDKLDAVIYARHMIRKRGIANAVIDQYDLLSLPYKESSFDLVTAFSVLDRFGPIELKIVIDSFRRILKPGGLLMVGYSVENAFIRFLHRELSFPFDRRRRTRQILEPQDSSRKILYPYVQTEGKMENLISSYGFSEEFSKNIGIFNLIKLYRVSVFKNHGKSTVQTPNPVNRFSGSR